MFDPVSLHKLSEVLQAERVEHLLRESEKPHFPILRPALRLMGRLLVRVGMALQGPSTDSVAVKSTDVVENPVTGPSLIPIARWRPDHADNTVCERRTPVDTAL